MYHHELKEKKVNNHLCVYEKNIFACILSVFFTYTPSKKGQRRKKRQKKEQNIPTLDNWCSTVYICENLHSMCREERLLNNQILSKLSTNSRINAHFSFDNVNSTILLPLITLILSPPYKVFKVVPWLLLFAQILTGCLFSHHCTSLEQPPLKHLPIFLSQSSKNSKFSYCTSLGVKRNKLHSFSLFTVLYLLTCMLRVLSHEVLNSFCRHVDCPQLPLKASSTLQDQIQTLWV